MSEKKVQEANPLPGYLPWLFAVYTLSAGFNTTVTMSYLMYFITEFTGVSAVAMAGVLTVARFADLGVSLIAGPVVQKSNTKLGAFRPWIVACPTLTWIGCLLCFFNPNIAISSKLVLLTIGYCMTHFPMNFLTVAQNSLVTKVAGASPDNRLALSARRIQGTNAGRILYNAITLPFITLFLDMGQNGYFIVIVIFGAIALAGASMIFFVTRDFDKQDQIARSSTGSASSIPISKMYGDSLRVPAVWVLLIVDIFRQTAVQLVGGCNTYFYRYSGGNLMYMALAGTVSSIIGLGAAMIAPPIARKLGKKTSSITSASIAAAIYVAIALFANGNPMLYLVCTSLINIGLAIVNSYGVNLYLDAAEIRLMQTGTDNRPFIMSLQNIPIKLAFIFQGPIIAFLLDSSRYSVVDGVGTMANTALFVRYLGFLPAAMYAITILIMMFGYRITDQQASEAAAANARAQQERLAAGPK